MGVSRKGLGSCQEIAFRGHLRMRFNAVRDKEAEYVVTGVVFVFTEFLGS